jgi:type II secretion system protein G
MNKGFTLIELIVVFAVLGLMAVAMLATLNPMTQIQKANDAKRIEDLAQIQRALEMYYSDNNSYPASTATYQISVKGTAVYWGSTWSPYISILPQDPKSADTFIYYSPASGNGQTYYLYANLETGGQNPQACNKGNACTSILSGSAGFPTANSCGGVCNYGVSSSNVSP